MCLPPGRMRFRLTGRDFEEINPDIRFSRLNAMALVTRVRAEQPAKIEIEFDGGMDGMQFLSEIAGDIGYYADISGQLATFEKV